MRYTISSEASDSSPKSGIEKIITFFNNQIEKNKPVDIAEVVESTGLSWTYVKKMLEKLKAEEYCGFYFEKLGNSWVTWKDRDHIVKKLDDTCGRFLKEE